MAGTIAHRGPDGHGLWHAAVPGAHIGLAHHRLSIIHHSGSHQPISTADGRWVLVFNGEVLNYRELRQSLICRPVDDGDAAVLLQGLAERGHDFLLRVRGQFAFVLVDTRSGTITAARDPVGILPLFYAELKTGAQHRIVMASEVRAILADPDFAPVVANQHLADYLLRRSVPAPHTLLDGIHKIRPGHVMTIDAAGRMRETCYWSPLGRDSEQVTFPERSDSTPPPDIDQLLRQAVDRALVADTPVGVFLSGGVDSTLLTALVRERAETTLTYSAGFHSTLGDESALAAATAQALGTTHHEVLISPMMYADALSPLSLARDSPLSEPADIALHYLARRATHDVGVVLSGEGADELFAGYPKYLVAGPVASAAGVPGLSTAARLLRTQRLPLSRGVRSTLRALEEQESAARRRAWFAAFTSREVRSLMSLSHVDIDHRVDPSQQQPPVTLERQAMREEDLTGWLPENLLSRADRMCMAAALEVRPPFLDLDLVEAALALPIDATVHRRQTKWPLREMARRVLPMEVARQILGRPKAGFPVPLDAWFAGELRDLLHDSLLPTSALLTHYLDRSVIRQLVLDHDRGRGRHGLQLWTLLSLEVWLRGLGQLPYRPS